MRQRAHFQTSFKTGAGGGCEHGGAGEERALETIGDAAGNVPDGKRNRDRDHAVDRIMPAEMERADQEQRRISRDNTDEREPQAESGDREKRSEENTSEHKELMRISKAVYGRKKKKK